MKQTGKRGIEHISYCDDKDDDYLERKRKLIGFGFVVKNPIENDIRK